ncbi:MAG: MFS transporter [Sphingobium sp.]|nr:MFS transporter [Sphingobium sp.]
MRARQIGVIALCVLLNALDGFDVLAISFASPGIATEWGIDRAALGLVLSMELIGMAVGSIWLGNLADRFGRRPVTLGCLVVMALGMWLATLATSVQSLSAFRLFTGLGIGGMLACTNIIVAEVANDRARSLSVAIMAAGYPVGAIAGGSFASYLLSQGDWRDVFLFGSIMTAICLPLAWFLLPESIGYLMQKRPANLLDRINKALSKLGHDSITAVAETTAEVKKISIGRLFGPDLLRITLLLTAAYFAHIMSFYFILKWIPKIVVDMGYAPSTAGGVLVWANVGSLTGALVLSYLSYRYPIKKLVTGTMVGSTLLIILFGMGQRDLTQLAFAAACAGFFTNAGVVGLYAIIAQSYPTEVRGGGTGFVIGIGRGGAALGPIIAGFLFTAGYGLQGVAIAMSLGSAIAAVALLALRPVKEQQS